LLEQRSGGDIQQIGVGTVGLEPPEAHLARRLVFPKLAQHRGVVLHEGDVGGLNRQRTRHQARRLGMVAVGGLDNAERMKRVGLSRISLDDLAIKLRSLGEFSASVQRKRLLQALGIVTVRHRKSRNRMPPWKLDGAMSWTGPGTRRSAGSMVLERRNRRGSAIAPLMSS